MEASFGHDFSAVRVHSGPAARAVASLIDAQAFTSRSDIVIDPSHQRAGSPGETEILAHELAHVVQQSRGNGAVASEGALEADAQQAARAVGLGRRAVVSTRASTGSVQRAAPAVAAAGVGAYALRCIIGVVVGALFDLAIQYGIHSWRRWEPPWRRGTYQSFRPDWCSAILAAALGCLGGMVALKWLEPLLSKRFAALGGGSGTLLGRLLMWVVQKAAIGLPRATVKTLLKLGCIKEHEAEVLAPGVTGEPVAEADGGDESGPEDAGAGDLADEPAAGGAAA